MYKKKMIFVRNTIKKTELIDVKKTFGLFLIHYSAENSQEIEWILQSLLFHFF